MRNKILQIIKSTAQKNNIKITIDESMLDKQFNTIGVDSLAIMSIIIQIETALNKQLPDEELLKIKTINQLIQAFEKIN